MQKCAEILVKAGKVKKRSRAVRKTIIELNGRAATFHKSSITLEAKSIFQLKNKRKSAAAIQSMGITN